MNKTDIEYLDYTWNPLAMLCTRTESPGCLNCWHQNFAKRHAANPRLTQRQRLAYDGSLGPVLYPDKLKEPLKLKKSSKIGVQFMGDLFHEKVHRDNILKIIMMIRQCPKHTFIILTKRPEKAKDFFKYWFPNAEALANSTLKEQAFPQNIWLGVSVSNQDDADRWIPTLLQIPAAKRFISYEPAIEAVSFAKWMHPQEEETVGDWGESLDLIIAGGESGPGARPAHPDWFRRVRDDCAAAGVPFMFKQWGEFIHGSQIQDDSVLLPLPKNDKKWAWAGKAPDAVMMCRVGKKAAGRHLDGVIHDGWPGE